MNPFSKTLALLALLGPWAAFAQTTSWTGAVNGDWSKPANWTAGVPTANTDAVIGDASFTGSKQPDLSSARSVCRSLTIGTGARAVSLKVDKTFKVFGNVTIGPNGTINHTATVTLSLSGNWSNGGKYNASNNGATVAFSGAVQSLSGATTFKRLTVNAGSRLTLGANIVVGNLLTVAGTVDPG